MDALLAAAIRKDSDPAVRAAAIFAARFRHPLASVIREALVEAARTDAAESVRSAAVSLMGQHPEGCPQTAETLAWVAEYDTKPGIRSLAAEALRALTR